MAGSAVVNFFIMEFLTVRNKKVRIDGLKTGCSESYLLLDSSRQMYDKIHSFAIITFNKTMSLTLAEKIIARAAGNPSARAGEFHTCNVDLAMIHDSGGPRRVKPVLEKLGVKVWDPGKVVVISDHFVPGFDRESTTILQLTREWVKEQGIPHFYDMQGICHVVLPEKGHLKPGMFVVGGDSHSTTGGAFGCFMFGIGSTDMAGVLATGETWIQVPHTIRVRLLRTLTDGCSAKDIMLALCGKLGLDGGQYQVIEFAGEAVSAMSMSERMTLCNMTAELGAQTGLIAADTTTEQFLKNAGVPDLDWKGWQDDENAPLLENHELDLASLEPQVALPHSPANALPVSHVEPVKLDMLYLGACTGAKHEDLEMAARLLKGRKVSKNTRLMVAPASSHITSMAAADGSLSTLMEAGAILMPAGCGACAGYGIGQLGENEVCLASTARNFQGRMGAITSKVYLASPYTVAASAVYGRIADPRPLLTEKP